MRDRNDATDVSEVCGCSCWCGRLLPWASDGMDERSTSDDVATKKRSTWWEVVDPIWKEQTSGRATEDVSRRGGRGESTIQCTALAVGSVSIHTWRSSSRTRNHTVEPRPSGPPLPVLAPSTASDPRTTKRMRKDDDIIVADAFEAFGTDRRRDVCRRVSSRMGSPGEFFLGGDEVKDGSCGTNKRRHGRPRAHLPRTTSVRHDETRWTVPSCSRGGAASESSLPQPEAETRPRRCGCKT